MAKRILMGEADEVEERVFQYLVDRLPSDYVIFTNLSITQGNHPYEFDAIILGRHAVYTVEVKPWGGGISGDAGQWEKVGEDGLPHSLPKNPLPQAEKQAKVLKTQLMRWNRNLEKIYVQECVCLASEEKPDLSQINDDPARLRKVRWYKDIEQFLTDPSFLPKWTHLERDNIIGFHEEISKAIRNGFNPSKRTPRRIGKFTILEKAWTSRRYQAYLASSEKGHYPARNLLKVYPIPTSIAPQKAQEFIDELDRELAALRQIQDRGDETTGGQKNVVIGYEAFPRRDANQNINQYVVVMEWVDGRPLSELVGTGRLELRQRYQIASQICRGLAFAHTAGIIHRNLNIKNILCRRNGEDIQAKIINFDFAKFLGQSPVGGTVRTKADDSTPIEIWKDYLEDLKFPRKYVAPEIRPLQGLPDYHSASKETDLYALGVILYELFSNKVLASETGFEIEVHENAESIEPQTLAWIRKLTAAESAERTTISLSDLANEFVSLAQGITGSNLAFPEMASGWKFKKYTIEAHIKSTRMSEIYLAVDTLLNQKVIVKFLRASTEDATREMLAAYRAWQAIDSHYIARWLDWGTAFVLGDKILENSQDPKASRIYYQVLEYLEGDNLGDWLRRASIETEKALDIAMRIVRAVAAMHKAELIHCDIKPDNIVLTKEDAIKIIDLDLSQRMDEPGTMRGVSPGYTPPEVIPTSDKAGEVWSFAGDVFSTAGVLAALFCGETADGSPNADRALLERKIGPEISNLILRDLDVEPQRRHQTAASMLEDLETAINRFRSKSMPTQVDYQKVLAKINSLIEEANDELDHARAAGLRAETLRLQEWLQGGKQGNCPIDISKYGVDRSTEETPGPETPGEKPPAEKPQDSAPKEAEQEQEAPLSPEERTILEQLKQVRTYLNMGQLREAVALAGLVESHATGDAKREAAQLLAEGHQKSDFAIRNELDKGDAALEAGDKDDARKHYEAVLLIDPENAHARSALQRLKSEDTASGELTAQKVMELRAGLKARKNLKQLGEAVYEAEALDSEGKLTAELAELLRQGREAYDALRVAQGEETTMMRFGDLTARKAARDLISNRMVGDEKFIYDATTNALRPASDLLKEADVLLEACSEETVQYEIEVINLLLPAHPIGAQERLQKALSMPFYEEHKRLLEKKELDIKVLIEKQQKAKQYLDDAARQDEIGGLRLLLEAQKIFEYLPEIDAKLYQAKSLAEKTLTFKLEDAYRKARSLIQMKDSAGAQNVVTEALNLAATWPMEEIPQRLQTLIQEGKRIQEFIAEAEMIRHEIGDPHRRGSALEKFQQLQKDARFADTPEMRSLLLEIDQYRDFDDQLREAEDAKGRGDWQRVHELTDHIRKSGKAGELGAQVESLFKMSEQELRIEEARGLLENGEVRKANNIISTILATEKDPVRNQVLKDRLEKDNAIIDRAIADSPPMQEMYNQALNLQEGSLQQRLEALRIFRHVGGISSEQPRKDWPAYCLSLRTADARKCAADLAETIRLKCLESLREAFEKSDKRNPLNDESLRYLSPYASALREGHLIYSDEERSLVRWVEVEWGKRQAQVKEEQRDWKSAVEIWRRLNLHYPETPEVEAGLRRARIQHVVIEAERVIYNEHDEQKAIQLLEAAQKDGLETSWEILLILADAYARQSKFDKVFGILAEAERYNADKAMLKKKRTEIEREQVIQEAMQAVEAKLALGSPREALIIIGDALSNPIARDSRRLKERQERVFLAAQETLLAAARQAREAATADNTLKAVTALVDLRELEELAKQPKSRCRAESELRHLGAGLSTVANTLLDAQKEFQSSNLTLDAFIRKADLLLGRLQTFRSIVPLFTMELGEMDERLESAQRQVASLLQRLRNLRSLLDDVNQPGLWERALLYNDFYEMEAKLQAIREIGLDNIPDVMHFEQQLLEWKDVNTYIIEQIKQLEQFFDVEEDFKEAIALLRRLSTRPAHPQKGREWKSVQQKEYEEILRLMETQFRIVNIYGDGQALIGRATIEAECQRRLQQLNILDEWDRHCAHKMDEAGAAMKVAEHYEVGSEQVPLLHQQRNWQNVLEKSQAALKILGDLPRDETGCVLPAFSKKAMDFYAEGEQRKKIAEEWSIFAQHALSDLDQMLKDLVPTEEDFKEAVSQRDWTRLERLLKQAKRAGALDEIGQRRIKVYEQVLQKARQPTEMKKSWRERFKLG